MPWHADSLHTDMALISVQALEERFQAMIEPAVAAALTARQADRVAALASLVADAGRESHLEAQYLAARLPMLQVPNSSLMRRFICVCSIARSWSLCITTDMTRSGTVLVFGCGDPQATAPRSLGVQCASAGVVGGL